MSVDTTIANTATPYQAAQNVALFGPRKMTQDGVHVTAPLERMVGSETRPGTDRTTDDASGTPAPTDSCSALQGTHTMHTVHSPEVGRAPPVRWAGSVCTHRIWCRGIPVLVRSRGA